VFFVFTPTFSLDLLLRSPFVFSFLRKITTVRHESFRKFILAVIVTVKRYPIGFIHKRYVRRDPGARDR